MAKKGEIISFTDVNDLGNDSDFGVNDLRMRYKSVFKTEEEMMNYLRNRPETIARRELLLRSGISEADIDSIIDEMLAYKEPVIEEPVIGEPIGEGE